MKLTVATSLLLIAVLGCKDRNFDRYQAGIREVLRQGTELEKALGKEQPNIVSSAEGASLIDRYCSGLAKIDFSNCPPNFRDAYYVHIRAWSETAEAVRRVPSPWEMVVEGILGPLVGTTDPRFKQYPIELLAARKKVESSFIEVKKIAAEYGVD